MSDEPFDEHIGHVNDFQVEKTVEAATKVTVEMLMSAIANCLYQCSEKVQVFDIPQMTQTQHISNAGLSSSGEAYHIEFLRASLDNPEHVMTLQVMTAIANCLYQCSARVQVFDTIPQMT